MKVKNVEFKARVDDLESYEKKLMGLEPEFRGLDHQVDTYFNATQGRLKLREGTIENALINYHRGNTADAKLSEVILYKHKTDPALKAILSQQMGVKVVVDKKRKIYFMENVKFHFDEVEGLGKFLEVEAIDETGKMTIEFLEKQCQYYFEFFELDKNNLQSDSYSDMLLLTTKV